MPMMINITLASSPSPKMMNRIGRIASGGTSDMPVTSGEMPARNSGSEPVAMPTTRPIRALIATPMPSRCRLARVSTSRVYSPLRLLGSKAMRSMASEKLLREGRSLSLGFASSRASEATRYNTARITKGSSPRAQRPTGPAWRLISFFMATSLVTGDEESNDRASSCPPGLLSRRVTSPARRAKVDRSRTRHRRCRPEP